VADQDLIRTKVSLIPDSVTDISVVDIVGLDKQADGGTHVHSTAEIAADRPIEVSFLPRGTAVADQDLIRTKVSLIPDSVTDIRVVDIVGLDKQADGGTHVHSTAEIGRLEVVKTESKGKGNKRLRVRVVDA
jgi:Ser-tRNA(Ala) deacylase AlaX